MNALSRTLLGALLPAMLAVASPLALAQQEQARVISSNPIRNADGSTAYAVTYEYAGRQYTTRTDTPPGDTIALQITPMGVTTNAVPDQAPIAADNMVAAPWQNVTPEPGMVVSGGGAPAGAYPAPGTYAPPVAYAPAPVVVAPAYGYGYGYGYPGYYPGYAYPPVGVSLNLGYSYYRGGGGWRRGWR